MFGLTVSANVESFVNCLRGLDECCWNQGFRCMFVLVFGFVWKRLPSNITNLPWEEVSCYLAVSFKWVPVIFCCDINVARSLVLQSLTHQKQAFHCILPSSKHSSPKALGSWKLHSWSPVVFGSARTGSFPLRTSPFDGMLWGPLTEYQRCKARKMHLKHEKNLLTVYWL